MDLLAQDHYDGSSDLPEDLFEQEEIEPPVDEFVTSESVEADLTAEELAIPESLESEQHVEEIPAPESVETEAAAVELPAEDPPSQEELNELVTDVTALGF